MHTEQTVCLLRILETKCALEVTDFKIVYNHKQCFDVHYYFHVFIFEHDYFVDSDSVEDSNKLISVGYQ